MSSDFDWHELLTLASWLATGPSAAQKRAAISRAYYAAYHVVRKSLLISALGEGSHQAVWDLAKKDAREQFRLAGRNGARLKVKRVAADYHPRMEFLDHTVKESIELAKAICNRIDPRGAAAQPAVVQPEASDKSNEADK